MKKYKATEDPKKVKKEETVETTLDIDIMIGQYRDLRIRYQNLPEYKLYPDEETLAKYNAEITEEREHERGYIRAETQLLRDVLNSIYESGLLPEEYNSDLASLNDFVNNM